MRILRIPNTAQICSASNIHLKSKIHKILMRLSMSQTFFMIICSKVYFHKKTLQKNLIMPNYCILRKRCAIWGSPHLKAEGGFPIDGWRPLWFPSPQGTVRAQQRNHKFIIHKPTAFFITFSKWRIWFLQLPVDCANSKSAMDSNGSGKKVEIVILGMTRP